MRFEADSEIRGLTVQQPFAELIARADPGKYTKAHAKQVENRTWETKYRGWLAIHAGKGQQYLVKSADGLRETYYDIEIKTLDFGSIIAVAYLTHCVQVGRLGHYPELDWLRGNEHVEGPYCWVLQHVQRLRWPIECKGRQGLWHLAAGHGDQIFNQCDGRSVRDADHCSTRIETSREAD